MAVRSYGVFVWLVVGPSKVCIGRPVVLSLFLISSGAAIRSYGVYVFLLLITITKEYHFYLTFSYIVQYGKFLTEANRNKLVLLTSNTCENDELYESVANLE